MKGGNKAVHMQKVNIMHNSLYFIYILTGICQRIFEKTLLQFGLKGFNKHSEARLVKRLFKGFSDEVLCLLFIHVNSFKMVIGLKHGKSNLEEEHLKELSYELVNKFTEMFKARNKTIKCRDLIGIDISTKEDLEKARDRGLFTSLCSKYVQDAVEPKQRAQSPPKVRRGGLAAE
jgi:hypothetical protein